MHVLSKLRTSLHMVALCALALTFAPRTHAASANDGVYGYWKKVDEDTGKTLSIFKLWKHDGKLVGRIVKTFPKAGEKAQTTCDECSGKQKGKPIIGLVFLWGFERDEDNARKWVDGTVLNPSDGETYNCEVELSEDGKKLAVFGYVRLLFKVGGTDVWSRPSAAELREIN